MLRRHRRELESFRGLTGLGEEFDNYVPRNRVPPTPAQWSSEESFNWIQMPMLHIYLPHNTMATGKFELSMASDERRTDRWLRLESLQFDKLQQMAMFTVARVRAICELDQLKITWCPRLPHRTTGYPLEELEDEVEVTESNFADVVEDAVRKFCGGEVPKPPNLLDADIFVLFIVRPRPVTKKTSVPAPVHTPTPPGPPSFPIGENSLFFREDPSAWSMWSGPMGPPPSDTNNDANMNANNITKNDTDMDIDLDTNMDSNSSAHIVSSGANK